MSEPYLDYRGIPFSGPIDAYGDFIPAGGGFSSDVGGSLGGFQGPPASAAVSAGVPWYTSLASGLSAAAGPVGMGLDIIDTITRMYGQYQANKQAEENRKLAMKMYEEQKAEEAENKAYNRSIAERSWNYTVAQNKQKRKDALKEDYYQKYMGFVKNFTNMINSEPQLRLDLAQAYRSI